MNDRLALFSVAVASDTVSAFVRHRVTDGALYPVGRGIFEILPQVLRIVVLGALMTVAVDRGALSQGVVALKMLLLIVRAVVIRLIGVVNPYIIPAEIVIIDVFGSDIGIIDQRLPACIVAEDAGVLMTLSVDILPVIDMGILTVEDVLALRLGTDQHTAVRFAVDRDGAPRVAVLFPMGISALFTDLGMGTVGTVIRVDVAEIPLAIVINIVFACSQPRAAGVADLTVLVGTQKLPVGSVIVLTAYRAYRERQRAKQQDKRQYHAEHSDDVFLHIAPPLK